MGGTVISLFRVGTFQVNAEYFTHMDEDDVRGIWQEKANDIIRRLELDDNDPEGFGEKYPFVEFSIDEWPDGFGDNDACEEVESFGYQLVEEVGDNVPNEILEYLVALGCDLSKIEWISGDG